MMVVGFALIVRAAKGFGRLPDRSGLGESVHSRRSYAILNQTDGFRGNKESLLAIRNHS